MIDEQFGGDRTEATVRSSYERAACLFEGCGSLPGKNDRLHEPQPYPKHLRAAMASSWPLGIFTGSLRNAQGFAQVALAMRQDLDEALEHGLGADAAVSSLDDLFRETGEKVPKPRACFGPRPGVVRMRGVHLPSFPVEPASPRPVRIVDELRFGDAETTLVAATAVGDGERRRCFGA